MISQASSWLLLLQYPGWKFRAWRVNPFRSCLTGSSWHQLRSIHIHENSCHEDDWEQVASLLGCWKLRTCRPSESYCYRCRTGHLFSNTYKSRCYTRGKFDWQVSPTDATSFPLDHTEVWHQYHPIIFLWFTGRASMIWDHCFGIADESSACGMCGERADSSQLEHCEALILDGLQIAIVGGKDDLYWLGEWYDAESCRAHGKD